MRVVLTERFAQRGVQAMTAAGLWRMRPPYRTRLVS